MVLAPLDSMAFAIVGNNDNAAQEEQEVIPQSPVQVDEDAF